MTGGYLHVLNEGTPQGVTISAASPVRGTQRGLPSACSTQPTSCRRPERLPRPGQKLRVGYHASRSESLKRSLGLMGYCNTVGEVQGPCDLWTVRDLRLSSIRSKSILRSPELNYRSDTTRRVATPIRWILSESYKITRADYAPGAIERASSGFSPIAARRSLANQKTAVQRASR